MSPGKDRFFVMASVDQAARELSKMSPGATRLSLMGCFTTWNEGDAKEANPKVQWAKNLSLLLGLVFLPKILNFKFGFIFHFFITLLRKLLINNPSD